MKFNEFQLVARLGDPFLTISVASLYFSDSAHVFISHYKSLIHQPQKYIKPDIYEWQCTALDQNLLRIGL